jgi:hypothetical protein
VKWLYKRAIDIDNDQLTNLGDQRLSQTMVAAAYNMLRVCRLLAKPA